MTSLHSGQLTYWINKGNKLIPKQYTIKDSPIFTQIKSTTLPPITTSTYKIIRRYNKPQPKDFTFSRQGTQLQRELNILHS